MVGTSLVDVFTVSEVGFVVNVCLGDPVEQVSMEPGVVPAIQIAVKEADYVADTGLGPGEMLVDGYFRHTHEPRVVR